MLFEFWRSVAQTFFSSSYATKWQHGGSRKDFGLSHAPLIDVVATLAAPNYEQFAHKPQRLKNQKLNYYFWKLNELGPAFPVRGDSIEFLVTPADFFQHLLRNISIARRRVVLCSLYIGVEPECRALVQQLRDALHCSPDLRVTILIDYLRGTRGLRQRQDSFSLLLPLHLEWPQRVQLRFFHTPLLSGVWKSIVPERFSEVIGVQHVKAYICDDDLIVSGANLSQSYFTNRLDRYMCVQGEPALANYFVQLIETIASFSFRPTGATSGANLLRLDDGVVSPFVDPEQFARMARQRLLPLLDPTPHPTDGSSDTYIFPLLQMSPFEILHEEQVTSFLLASAQRGSTIHITSPYFNLNPHYVSLVLRGTGRVDIVTAHPQANGFFTAQGLAGAIPAAYTFVERQFFEQVQRYSQQDRIHVFEWRRAQWTFHAKGLWFAPDDHQLPAITLIGSSNLGIRSARRDLEAQLFVVTENAALRQRLELERRNVFGGDDLTPVHEQLFREPDRHVSWSVRLIAELVRTFL